MNPANPTPSTDAPGPVAPTAEARVFALVYISKAARELSLADLEHLCERARARNLTEGVTGLLLHSDGAFMQYLEGPAPGLSRVYGVIKSDPMHYGVIDLLREPIDEREFSDWAMALRDVGPIGLPDSPASDDALTRRIAGFASAHTRARDLLGSFWSRGRRSVATRLDPITAGPSPGSAALDD